MTRSASRRLLRSSLFGLALVLPASAAAQDQIHYIPPFVARGFGGNEVDEHRLVLSTNTPGGGTVAVLRGDGTPLPGSPFAVTPGNPTVVDLGSGGGPYENLIEASSVNTVLPTAGLVCKANTPSLTFFAEIRHRDGNQGGSATMKGRLALGRDFRSGHLASDQNSPVSNEDSHFISVMATEDDTVVQFSDISPGIALVGPPPGSVTLNAGESYAIQYQLAAGVNADLMNGTRITSSKPIAVNCGSWLAGNRPSSSGRDIGIDQITPIDYLRNEWVVFQGIEPGEVDEMERPTVVAAFDGTQVFVNGSSTPLATLDAGDSFAIPPTNFQPSVPNGFQVLYVTTSKNAYLYQSVHNALNGPALGLVPPLPCASSDRVDVEEVDFWGPAFLRIVTRPGATLQINGAAPPPTSGPDAVPGTSNWVVYDVQGLTGDVTVDSTEQFVVSLHTGQGNLGTAGTYTGFSNAPLVISPFEIPGSTVSYPVTLTLEQATGYLPNQFQWYRNGVALPGETGDTLVVTSTMGPGTYTVTGTSALCGVSPQSFAVVLPAELDIELETVSTSKVNDTQYDVVYRATVTNRSGGTVSGVRVTDDLEAALAPLVPGTHWTLAGGPPLVRVGGAFSPGEENPSFDGRTGGDTELLGPGVDLAQAETGTIEFTVRVDITGGFPAQDNVATVREQSATYGDTDQTPFPALFELDVAIRAGPASLVSGTTYDVPYVVTARNLGNLPLTSLQLVQDLEAAFSPLPTTAWSIQSGPAAGGAFAPGEANPGYTGLSAGDRDLLVPDVDLLPAETGTLSFVVRIDLAGGIPSGTLRVSGSADHGIADDSDDDVGTGHLSIDGPDPDADPTNDPTPFPVPDADGDGVPDPTDIDDDGDGIPDASEGPDTLDTDGDGVIDRLDRDSDSDGIPDLWESGISAAQRAALDPDADGDTPSAGVGANGLEDTLESPADSGTLAYTLRDTDGDGYRDFQDLDSDDDGIVDVLEVEGGADADGDALLDGAGSDADGDGLPDAVDPTHDGRLAVANPAPPAGTPVTLTNSDPDPTPDVRDVDADNDGVPDLAESGDSAASDPDGDGLLDGGDGDADGIRQGVDRNDSAFGSPGTPIPAPANTSGSGAADFQVLDRDGSGATDRTDFGLPSGPGTADADGDGRIDDPADADGDGVPDAVDRRVGTFGYPESVDPDGDGLRNPNDLDDDDDGIPDLAEQNGDPNRDTDGDGLPDHLDRESDGDGVPDLWESGIAAATLAVVDPDGDGDVDAPVGANGLADLLETAPDSGTIGYVLRNTDGRGPRDFQDRDADDDGLTDAYEARGADGNGDGVLDGAGSDADGDGLADLVDPTHDGPNAGFTAAPPPGTALARPDTDGDGLRDLRDLDSDDDGLPDVTEGGGADADGDGVLDGAGSDADGDGLADAVDPPGGTPPSRPDTDGDGRMDAYDLDADNDGLSDLRESGNPAALDADGDGVIDGGDADADGLRDAVDGNDAAVGSGGAPIPSPYDDPATPGSPNYRNLDSDGDGTPDRLEASLPSGSGTVDADGDGAIDNPADADADGIADAVDRQLGVYGGVELVPEAPFRFSAPSYLTHEAAGTATITVIRTGSLQGSASIDFATADDEATAPGDYGATTGTLAFASGQASATFAVPIADDALEEPAEALQLLLIDPTAPGRPVDLAALVIEPEPNIAIATPSLPGGSVGVPYEAGVRLDDGGVGPTFSWAVVAGAIPPGLALIGTGREVLLRGTPVSGGTFAFDLRASDDADPSRTDTRSYTVVVGAGGGAPEIGAVGTLEAPVGLPFSRGLSADGGQGPLAWSLTSGSLPAGVFLDPFAGRLVGTPLGPPASNAVCVQTTDANGQTDTTPDGACAAGEEVVVDVVPNPVRLVTYGLDDGTAGAPYSAFVDAEGGVGSSYTWSVSAGALPPGLSLTPAGLRAAITGTPTVPGSFAFTLTVADDAQAGAIDRQDYLVKIDAPAGSPRITTSSLPTGTVGQPYAASIAATGGVPGYSFAVRTGALPAGLSLDPATGALSGTPTVSGEATFTVEATDAAAGAATRIFTLAVNDAPRIVTDQLPLATQGAGYGFFVEGAGGTPPYEWSLVGGSSSGDAWSGGGLPAGLVLSGNSGSIAGIPTAAPGSYPFVVQLRDRNGATAQRTLTVVVGAPPATPTVLTRALPRGTVGVPYAASLVAAGGTPGYTWTLIAGALPTWATLDPATGVIHGVPSLAGTSAVQFQATDQFSASGASPLLDLEVVDPLNLTPTALPQGTSNVAYAQTLVATGGQGPYTFGILTGELPSGLALDAQSGQIRGTSPLSGSFPLVVRVTDARGETLVRSFTLVLAASSPPAITTTGLPAATVGAPYSASISGSGGQPPYTWSVVAGALPPGLSLDPSSGALTGAPTQSGSFAFTVELRDQSGATTTAALAVQVAGTSGPGPLGTRVQGSGSCALGRPTTSPGLAGALALLLLFGALFGARRRAPRAPRQGQG
ncbi:MAG: hypothetical protein D6731_25960 [Planctomycetota bacterium]|nr:MAG: hypothetical protein D6731_25960 [Planctomycetota bacterium]